MMRLLLSMLVMAAALSAAMADDQRESAFRGKRMAEANCATCHAIAQVDMSTLRSAPPLREIGGMIAFTRLRNVLTGQVFLEHAIMPDFEPTEAQADDLATYIHSIASR